MTVGQATQDPGQRLGLVEDRKDHVDLGGRRVGHDGNVPPPSLWSGLVVAAAIVAALYGSWVWGQAVERHVDFVLGIDAYPFHGYHLEGADFGEWRLARTGAVLLPLAVAAAALAWVPRLVRGLPWRWLLVAAFEGWVVWVVAIALVDGPSWPTAYLDSRYDYLTNVDLVGSPGAFLAQFTDRIEAYTIHVQGHPPGALLAFWGLDRIGLGGSGAVVALSLVGGGLAVVAVLVTARSLAGESFARRAAPFVALSPAALIATNVDLIYSGLVASAIALVALASETYRSQRSATALAVGGGAMLGLAAFGSYGLAPMALVVIAVLGYRRRVDLLAAAALATVAVLAVPAGWGFWWPEGVQTTTDRYWATIANQRPWYYFTVANVVIAAALVGPVTLVALTRLRNRALWTAVGGVLVVLAVALASQMSKGEVERIWQPFYPWLVVACGAIGAALPRHRGPTPARPLVSRPWLALHLAAGLALAFTLESPW